MALTLNPNTPQVAVIGQPLCFEGTAGMSIPQEDLRSFDIPASGTNWTYNSATQVFKKVSGGIAYDAVAISDNTAYGKQPFYIKMANVRFTTPGPPNNNYSCYIRVIDDQDRNYIIEVIRYCNSAYLFCTSDWIMNVKGPNGTVYTRGVNFSEIFFIRSDGISLIFEHIQGGVLVQDYVMALPETGSWRMAAGALFVNNEIALLSTFKGTYQGNVPITWTAPLGGSLSGTVNNQCFIAPSTGDYRVCIATEFEGPLCVDIHASPLDFHPEDFSCGDCVFTNEIVKFYSNGGTTGTLTVLDDHGHPVGTVIDSLTWQAPGRATHVTATYTLDEDHIDCELNVVPKLKILNVEGDTILGMAPGETFKIDTNYEFMGGEVRWENLDCPNLVSPEGYLTIPRNYRNGCFGAIDCYIRVTAVIFPGGTVCDNFDPDGEGTAVTMDLRVIVDPIFPTPEFGGPKWTKWKPETPEFRVLTQTMEGGCVETHIRNRVPIQKWRVNYDGLKYEDTHVCNVPSCCGDPLGFVEGVDPNTQTAKMLDDFWMLVAGQYGFFTLVDPKTGRIWRRVRFEGAMERDHVNWKTIHSRTFTLAWHPCCATEPAGGVCPHNTVREDTYPPSTPSNVEVEALSWSELRVSWDPSVDNVGIKRYEIARNEGEPVELGGSSVFYTDTRLQASTTYTYKVRAIDYSNNPSEWSVGVSGTTFDRDITPPSVPTGLVATTVDAHQIDLVWNANPEFEEVAGYKILAGYNVIDVGNVTSYSDTGLDDCTYREYYIKAYDASGNKSRWSRRHWRAIASTECGEVMEGTDIVMEDADTVFESHSGTIEID